MQPPGEYGLQGRFDKEIEGITYGFEVFARIKVLGDVDQLKLEPVPVTITPLFEQGQPVSIVLDEDRKKAIKWLIDKEFKQGSYGFPKEGWEDKTVDAYGVRSTPSGWLISNDSERKILISQHEFFKLARVKSSITEIVRDRIDGKDTPTPAKEPESEGEKE